MDIYECHDRYRISLKKLRLMHRHGVLNVEKEKTPEHWLRAISDLQKGKMSARSIALAVRFPEKLAKFHYLTRANRRVLQDHLKSVGFPDQHTEAKMRFSAPLGAVEKHPLLMSDFIAVVKQLIPAHDVDYYYLAVRVLLICETDFQMNMMSENLTRAFSSIRDEHAMQGWWHTEAAPYGKNRVIYHPPRSYDL